ncbi:aldehyde dehydrogenase family protein [Escherichia coli]
MITRKAGPALAAGSAMVLNPASQHRLCMALAELAIRAGIPAGVSNVVAATAGAVGNELTSNPMVRKLSFTSSTRNWPPVNGTVRERHQKSVAGAGRQHAVYRL